MPVEREAQWRDREEKEKEQDENEVEDKRNVNCWEMRGRKPCEKDTSKSWVIDR